MLKVRWTIACVAVASVVAGCAFGPAGAPSSADATAVGPNKIVISWVGISAAASGYLIERSLSSGINFEEGGSVDVSATTFDDTGLTNDTTYFYRIAAFNSTGNSLFSDEVSDTTFNPLFGTAKWDEDRGAE